AVGEVRLLRDAVDVGLGVAPAYRQRAAAGAVARLEHGDLVARLLQLVRRRQARRPGADDHDLLGGPTGEREVAALRRRPRVGLRLRGGGRGEPDRTHRREHDAGAGADPDGLEEAAARDAGRLLVSDHVAGALSSTA